MNRCAIQDSVFSAFMFCSPHCRQYHPIQRLTVRRNRPPSAINQAGLIFWFVLKRLAGSYLRFT